MRRPHALLAVSVVASVASAALVASLVVACGGNDKPPLTPDNLEENAEAGAAPATSGAPATPSPGK
jgi:hypothetical protein